MGTSGDRRIYVWWGAGFAFLALLAVFGWYFLRPYLEVRAAVGRVDTKIKSFEGEPRVLYEEEVKALGGPEQAAAKCSLYVRCPERLATRDEKRGAFRILGVCGPPAFPWAESLLHSHDWLVRAGAAETLGRLKDPRAVEPLIGTLKDPSADVRSRAAMALGELQDPRAVEPLIGALKDSNAAVRYGVTGALGWLRDPRTVEPLIGALKDPDANVRYGAAGTLGCLQDRRAVEPLKKLLADPDEKARFAAKAAIQEIEAARPE